MPAAPQDFRTRSFEFACQITRLFKTLDKLPEVPSYIGRQVLRSGTSIGANLEEAKAAQSRRDLVSKFSIALKEARETRYWLRLLVATESTPAQLLTPALEESSQLVAILTASLRRLKRQ
jgi:four helix bundle protein